jgi:hypothetical protein
MTREGRGADREGLAAAFAASCARVTITGHAITVSDRTLSASANPN